MSDITQQAIEYERQKQEQAALTPSSFDPDQLLKALYWIWDVFDRANVEFFSIKDTAKAVKNDMPLTGNGIDAGVRRLEWVSGGKRLIDAFASEHQVEETENDVLYKYEGVPVRVKFYDDNPCLASLNTVMYQAEAFKLANPYDDFVAKYE